MLCSESCRRDVGHGLSLHVAKLRQGIHLGESFLEINMRNLVPYFPIAVNMLETFGNTFATVITGAENAMFCTSGR